MMIFLILLLFLTEYVESKLGYEYRTLVEFEKVNRTEAKNKNNQKASSLDPSSQISNFYLNSIKKQLIRCSKMIVTANRPITSIAINFDNWLFASVNSDCEITLRDISTGQIVANLRGHTDIVNSLIVNPKGTTLASGGKDKIIRFWDLKAEKIIKTFGDYFDCHSEAVLALALSPDNKVLISYGADNIINTWDVKRAQIINSIPIYADLTCLEISHNCKLFSTGSLESQFDIRQTADGRVIRSIDNNSGVLCLAFSPNSNILATGGVDRLIRLWDISTGNLIYTLFGHSQRISNLVFASDRKNLISAGGDGVIKVWQLRTGKEITSIEAHSSSIQAIAIAPDCKTLISGDAEGKIKIWNCLF